MLCLSKLKLTKRCTLDVNLFLEDVSQILQSVYEDVARDTNRGHTVRAVSESFQQAKDAGFKVVSHMMPDLPNVDFERDIDQFVVRHVTCANYLMIPHP